MGFFESLFKVLTFGLFTLLQDWLAPETPSEAIKTEKNGSNKPIPVNYGENILGAIKIHKYVTDTPEESDNDLLHLICVFCEGEVGSVDELFFNEISENDPKFTGGRLAGGKWYEKHVYTGAAGQPASAAAVSGIPNWTIDHKLSGLCYAYIVLQLPWEESDERREVWKGEPQITARIKGKKVYDPRTGTTAYSSNPALCIRDFITNPIYGLGLPESFVVDSRIESLANACDEGVSTTQTITQYSVPTVPGERPVPSTTTTVVNHPRFSCNLVVQTETNQLENFNKILRTFRGIAQDMTSSAKLTYETTIEETYGVGTTVDDLFHFNADTMLDDFEFDSGDIKDRFNVVEVKFRNRLKEFEEDSVFFPADSNPLKAQWLAEDNGIEQKGDFSVDGITSKADALQWAEIVAKRSRFTKSVSVTGMPITIMVEVGDIVAVDSQMNGWTKKPFRVMEKELQDDDSVAFKLREHEDAVYPWSGRSFSDTVGGTWLGDPNNLAAVTGITLTPDPTLAKTGTLSWSYGANAFVRGYQVRLKDDLGNIIYDVRRPSKSWLVPLIDAGSYVAEVYAVSTTGAVSPTAAYAFTLTAPAQPSSITLTPRDWEIEAAAQLAGIGLGTVFEYDIVAGDGTGHTPESMGRATTFTFTGLLPDTLYTVYARAINAYGISDWISASATTTNTGAQVGWIIEPIQDDLDWLNSELDGVDALLEQVSQDISEIGDRQAVSNRLSVAQAEIDELNDTTLPALQQELDAAEGEIDTLQTVTIPAIQQSVGDVQGEVDTLNTTTIPDIQQDITDAETAISGLDGKFPVGTTDIQDDAITTPKLITNAITTDKILANSVTTAKLDALAVTADKIAANAVTADKILANAVTTAKLDALAVTADKVAANAVTAAKILAGAVTTDKMTANSINGDRIAANTLAANKIIANSITAAQIAALTITADEIAGNTITAAKIAALTITAAQIAAETITGDKIVARTIGADRLVANSITADEIAANAITSDSIQANAITGKNISGGTIDIGSGTFTVDSSGNLTATSGLFKGVVDIERGGSRLRIDPSNDLMFWFGPDTVPVQSQGKDNGTFWIAADGQYSVPVNKTVFSSVVTTGVIKTFTHLTVKGGADLDCRYKFENFNLTNIQSINGNNHTLTFTLKKNGVVIGATTVPVTVIGSPPWIVTAESGEVVISTSFDNSALPYFTEQDFSIETSVNWDITFTTPTLPTMEGGGFIRISELRTLS